MSRIVIGVEGSTRSKDAVAFAGGIARLSQAGVLLVEAYPYDTLPSRAASPEFREYLREDAEGTLRRMRGRLTGVEHVETVAVADVSPARALHEIAEREGAQLIVIGSSHRGAVGRVLAGTTAERLLHGAPCSVAVVPDGYRKLEPRPIRTIGVAYDGSEESKGAFEAATAMARATGAALRVIRVFEPDLGRFEDSARGMLDTAVAAVPDGIATESALVVGDAVDRLAEQTASVDVMVAGSRAYGPHRAVIAGSVSGRLVRKAACPVIVVPRGMEAPLGELFAGISAQAYAG